MINLLGIFHTCSGNSISFAYIYNFRIHFSKWTKNLIEFCLSMNLQNMDRIHTYTFTLPTLEHGTSTCWVLVSNSLYFLRYKSSTFLSDKHKVYWYFYFNFQFLGGRMQHTMIFYIILYYHLSKHTSSFTYYCRDWSLHLPPLQPRYLLFPSLASWPGEVE